MLPKPLVPVAVLSIGTLLWHEARVFGDRIDDQEWVEAAPVIAGLIVAVGFGIGAELTMPTIPDYAASTVTVWDLRLRAWERAIIYGAGVTGLLVVLEAALADEGYIEQDWLLFEPLRRGDTDDD